MAKKAKTSKKRAKRRSGEQVQELLSQVEVLKKAGEPLMKALAKLGISYSNYNYWVKKRGGTGAGRGKGRAAGGTRGGVFSVLDEMRANRAARHELEKQMRALDTKFNQLKFKLSRS
ncbi:MAG: hypothetical protein HUU46_03200 [Candidatus Hydrogenedentes bacterium]|nr:hypothetical protein [Candidatus Hydrogenedentota bacterium]